MNVRYIAGGSGGSLPQSDDQTELVDRLRKGDKEAFASVFRAFYPSLCTFVFARLRSSTDSEDLVMDVFRRVWERRESLRIRCTLRSYLFAAADHAAIDHLRRQRVELALVRDVEAQVRALPMSYGYPSSPAKDAERAELTHAMAQAVDELPERCRATFVLWQQQFSYSEIADTLNVSVKTVETQLARAFKSLRSRLGEFYP
jgi:RNA polymerase sigma-70 factor, ECF subfamily